LSQSFVSVVLDRRQNPDADTGTFELAYRQVVPKAPAYLGLSLCVNGKKLYKKTKERKHEPKSVAPTEPRLPSGDTNTGQDQSVPAEYSGPIITDFLTWLNPYDALPTNKEGIVLIPKEALTVRRAITVVKSGIALNSTSKKRKTSLSSRTHRGRRERNYTECKRRIVPHSCYRPDEDKLTTGNSKFRTESARKADKPKIDRSVGNKRCYIDPLEWERETASILRPTISVQNKILPKADVPVSIPYRQTKSGIIGSHKLLSPQNFSDSPESLKKLSAIGRNICNLREDSRNKQKAITFSKSCTSIYAPYRVVVTPLNDMPQSSLSKRKGL
jgi:hypothetical protein